MKKNNLKTLFIFLLIAAFFQPIKIYAIKSEPLKDQIILKNKITINKGQTIDNGGVIYISIKDFCNLLNLPYNRETMIHSESGDNYESIRTLTLDNKNLTIFLYHDQISAFLNNVSKKNRILLGKTKNYIIKNNEIYLTADCFNKFFNINIKSDLDDRNKFPYLNKSDLVKLLSEKGLDYHNELRTYDDAENILKSINEILLNIDLQKMTDKEKLEKLHDVLCEMNEYDYEALKFNDKNKFRKWTYSATGVSKYKKSVCAGYAEYYMLICNAAGLDVRTITGTFNGGYHVWNYYYKNGIRYHIDATANDTGSENSAPSKKWFYLTDKELLNKVPGKYTIKN